MGPSILYKIHIPSPCLQSSYFNQKQSVIKNKILPHGTIEKKERKEKNMTNPYSNFHFSLTLVMRLILTSLLLNGCGNDEKNNFSTQQKVRKYAKDTLIKGKVSNKKGMIRSGKIKVTNIKGGLIVSTTLQNDYHYTVTIPAGTELPIELHFYPKTVNEYNKKMIVAVIYPNIKNYDINELSSAIAKKAKALGGYTHYHMMRAAESSVNVPDANKTTSGFKGDPTKQYGGWH